MIPANELPLLDVLDLNLREIHDKKVVLYGLLRLGGPPGTTEKDDEYKLCPAIATVFGDLRDTIINDYGSSSKYNATVIVERLLKAYNKYDDDSTKKWFNI